MKVGQEHDRDGCHDQNAVGRVGVGHGGDGCHDQSAGVNFGHDQVGDDCYDQTAVVSNGVEHGAGLRVGQVLNLSGRANCFFLCPC